MEQQETTLAEQELVNSLSWLISLRWIAGIGVLLATLISTYVLDINVQVTPLFILVQRPVLADFGAPERSSPTPDTGLPAVCPRPNWLGLGRDGAADPLFWWYR
jgi:hypothetical protein